MENTGICNSIKLCFYKALIIDLKTLITVTYKSKVEPKTCKILSVSVSCLTGKTPRSNVRLCDDIDICE